MNPDLKTLGIIARALALHDGNVSAAARGLDVSRGWLLRRMRPAGSRNGRPRKEEADRLIAVLERDGLGRRAIADVLGLVGYEISEGTIRRRLREIREKR